MSRLTRVSAGRMPVTFRELVQKHPPSAIHDEVAYDNASAMIDALTRLPELTPGQSQYLDTLSILIEAYEKEQHPIDTSGVGPLDVLRHLMSEHDMTASDLGRLLGERSLGPKILSGQRGLSKAHIRTLSAHFGVPADLLI
jgi:HTH-type transcriptional regulator/antitoxin HigA